MPANNLAVKKSNKKTLFPISLIPPQQEKRVASWDHHAGLYFVTPAIPMIWPSTCSAMSTAKPKESLEQREGCIWQKSWATNFVEGYHIMIKDLSNPPGKAAKLTLPFKGSFHISIIGENCKCLPVGGGPAKTVHVMTLTYVSWWKASPNSYINTFQQYYLLWSVGGTLHLTIYYWSLDALPNGLENGDRV